MAYYTDVLTPAAEKAASTLKSFRDSGTLLGAFTSQYTQAFIDQTRQDLKTVRDALGLLKATYRTISGYGEIIEIDEYQPHPFPDHWTEYHETFGGHVAAYTEMTVEDSVGTIVCAMGHGTEATYYKPWIDLMNKKGFNVVTLELPRPGTDEYFENGDPLDIAYEKIVGDAILNPESPLYRNIPDHHTVALLTHSASGQAFESNIAKFEDKARIAKDLFDNRIYHTGIMLDTAHSSQKFFPLSSALYNWFSQCEHVRDKRLGSTEADRFWLREELEIEGKNFLKATQTNPTHGQARCLKVTGIDLLNRVENIQGLSDDFINLKRTIIMGEDEKGACPLSAEFYASSVAGIRYISVEGVQHNPLMECAEVYKLLMREVVSPTRAAQAAADALPSRALHAV
jgi:hypothetical protein